MLEFGRVEQSKEWTEGLNSGFLRTSLQRMTYPREIYNMVSLTLNLKVNGNLHNLTICLPRQKRFLLKGQHMAKDVSCKERQSSIDKRT